MARISILIAVLLTTLTSMAQGVVDTPFWEGADSVWAYTATIGYTENRRIVVDTIQWGLPSRPLQRTRYFADNLIDGSNVMVEEHKDEWTTQSLIEVRYTWQYKKMMPKGLPKEQMDTSTDFYLTYGTYKNHYFMSILGNRITGPRGVSYLEGDCGGGGHHHHHGGGHHHRR